MYAFETDTTLNFLLWSQIQEVHVNDDFYTDLCTRTVHCSLYHIRQRKGRQILLL